ncbi:hypothetical protein [Ottowia thiooxydans]|uniref:hypothetical protein n=1 Tax=Ottowia thiooxydans TaxID=219182 RepID=UPI00040505BE|nr:hypothetical protein [Ottowia thiooxydans]
MPLIKAMRRGFSTLFPAFMAVWMPTVFAQEAPVCVSSVAYLPLDASEVGADANGIPALGTYERISPDGRFILRSYSGAQLGKVSLMELPAAEKGAVKAYRTPFSNEAFPVQGSWRYLVDVSGEHYRFADVLTKQAQARPLFKAGMTGFYAAASEMPSRAGRFIAEGDFGTIHIRSLSWPQNANADNQGVGPLQMTTIEVKDDGHSARVVSSTGSQFICQSRRPVDGSVYALPMLSVDGTEFSAIPQIPEAGQPSMRVYGLSKDPKSKEQACDLRADLGFSPSKAVFGFPEKETRPAWLTYSDVGHVYVFDRELRLTIPLDHGRHRVLASAFPGLTRDGRVIYGATWRECPDAAKCPEKAGYVVADPYQSQAYKAYWSARQEQPPKACITRQDVDRERAEFARLHRLLP